MTRLLAPFVVAACLRVVDGAQQDVGGYVAAFQVAECELEPTRLRQE